MIAALGREVLQIGAADLEGVEHEAAGLVVGRGALQNAHHLPESKLQGGGLAVGGQRAIQFLDLGNNLVKLAKTLSAPRGRTAARATQPDVLAARRFVGGSSGFGILTVWRHFFSRGRISDLRSPVP